MIVVIILLIFAGFLKAVKDRLDAPKNSNGDYYTPHIMPTKGTFWNKGTGKKFFGWYFDAWHVSDLFYILSFCTISYFYFEPILHASIIEILVLFTITQLSFNLFYYLLKKK